MKIISWNVNGIRSCWVHGLSGLTKRCQADIYALQETKTDGDFHPVELDGYHAFWSHCEARKGYSGTMCLTRRTPQRVRRDIGDPKFDTEGRILTLEFEDYIFVNCYVPRSKGSLDRFDYRSDWDLHLFQFLKRLREKKPVIVCGDFNVAITNDDIYEGNQQLELASEGFQTLERENIMEIVGSGFVDSYRHIHPHEKGKYTWWSQRRFKRRENKGWRLDYFFVDERIKHKVRESTMLTDVQGSDHCPIWLDINLPMQADVELPAELPPCPYTYQNLSGRDERFVGNLCKRYDLGSLWESVDWDLAERNLRDMQMALSKSAYTRDGQLIAKWQKIIVRSVDARLLAVRHVCSTLPEAGVDGIRWETPHERMCAALSLASKGYRSMPSIRVVVTTKGGKRRNVHIETYYDRAMQCLYAYALDPIAESWGDRQSFAYRRGRSAFDMNEYIKQGLSGSNAPEWVFVADVTKCYERISHDWVMEHIPMPRHVLHQFLEAGYIFHGRLFPMDEGVGIGCSLSPIIANMTLDGLQDHIYSQLHFHSLETDRADGNMVRYADDILVMCRTAETARQVWQWTSAFLDERGLTLSPQKCMIVNIREGFDFMGRTYYKVGDEVYCRPSEKAIEAFKENIRNTVVGYTGSQQKLIEKLNQKISGWASYHKVGEADGVFREMDTFINGMLVELCRKLHPSWKYERIIEKYWLETSGNRHCYALVNHKDVRVKPLEETLLINYDAVKTDMNPYIHLPYMEMRSKERKIFNVVGVYRSIWNRQNGCCHYCGHPILRDEEKALVEVEPTMTRYAARMAYVHSRCRLDSIDYVEAAEQPDSATELGEILERILERKDKPLKAHFFLLSEYFRNSKKRRFTLTFAEMEAIMGKELGNAARKRTFWTQTGFDCISQCWNVNGYQIKELHLEQQKIEFYFACPANSSYALYKIPDALTGWMPADAVQELETFHKYIIKKYAL